MAWQSREKSRWNRIAFLIGARGSGKTSIGKKLAAALGCDFRDTDQHMLESDGLTVQEVVEREGWPGFRRRESQALRDVSRPGTVIATGGGMILGAENRAFMRELGVVLYLSAPAAVLARRLLQHPDDPGRPSLTGLSPVAEMAVVVQEREPLYRETAHAVVDAGAPEDVVLSEALRLCWAHWEGDVT